MRIKKQWIQFAGVAIGVVAIYLLWKKLNERARTVTTGYPSVPPLPPPLPLSEGTALPYLTPIQYTPPQTTIAPSDVAEPVQSQVD